MNALLHALHLGDLAGKLKGVPLAPMALLIVAVVAGAAFFLRPANARTVISARVAGLREEEEKPVDRGPRWHDKLGQMIAAHPAVGSQESQKIANTLASAGLDPRTDLYRFIALKAGGLLLTPALASVLLVMQGMRGTAVWAGVIIIALIAGWRVPDMIVGRMARRRIRQLENGIPDALDLLVICAEAGLGLEQGLGRVARDLKAVNPAVSRELFTTVAEMSVIRDRREALDNFARRTGLAEVRSMVGTLAQTLKYGTPLAHSLRVIAAEMRAAKMLRFEERAARLPVMLTVPLIVFILPCLFLIVVGPAVIQMIDLF